VFTKGPGQLFDNWNGDRKRIQQGLDVDLKRVVRQPPDFPPRDFPWLIKIRSGKWKCVLDQFHPRRCVIRNDDLHDIESEKNVGIIEHSQPRQCAARNALLFLSIDRRERPAKIFPGACFYFDEDERVVVATHDVDLAAASPFEVTIKNFVALPPQEAGGQFLAVSAAPEMLRLR